MSGYGAGGSHRRASQIDFRFSAAHPAHEVAVGGRDASFVIRQNSHVSAKTRTARWRAEGSPGFDKGRNKALIYGIKVYLLRARNYNTAHMRVHFSAP